MLVVGDRVPDTIGRSMGKVPWRGPEKRRFPRARKTIFVKIMTLGRSDPRKALGRTITGVTEDLSRGGFGAWVSEEIEECTPCMVRFFNAQEHLDSEMMGGQVRRLQRDRDGFRIGFAFDTPLERIRGVGTTTQ